MSSIAEMLIEISQSRESKQAVLCEGESVTYGELLHASLELAGLFSKLDLQKGDRVASLSYNSIGYIQLFYTCALFGFILVPLNYRLSIRELEQMLHNASPKIVFFGENFIEPIQTLRSNFPSVSHWIEMSAKNQQPWRTALKKQDAAMSEIPHQHDLNDRASEILLLVFTSGTTGTPKAAAISQKALYGSAQEIKDTGDIKASDNGLIIQPLFHVGANFLWLAHASAGASIRLEQKFNPLKCWEILSSTGISTIQLAPTMLEMMLTHSAKFSSIKGLRTIFYSTAPIREDLLRRAIQVFGNIFVQHYGSTEAGVVTTLNKSDHKIDGSSIEGLRLKSAGVPNVTTQIKIIDDQHEELEPNRAGEICVKHQFIFSGYWKNKTLTRDLLEDSWLQMGDIGYVDEDGFLFIVDRKKDLIISGGENIYPREVEVVLYSYPAIIECAVVGVPDTKWGESVVAEVVVSDHNITETELIDYCRKNLASYKKPKKIVFRDQLPRLATGKINKAKIKDYYWKSLDRSI